MKNAFFLVILIVWDIRSAYSAVTSSKSGVQQTTGGQLINGKQIGDGFEDDADDSDIVTSATNVQFIACCRKYFENDQEACTIAFNKGYDRNSFFPFTKTLTMIQLLNDEFHNFSSGPKNSIFIEQLQNNGVGDNEKLKIKKIFETLSSAVKGISLVDRSYEAICDDHASFIRLKPEFIDAELYGTIMSESMFFYSSGFDDLMTKLVNEIQSKEEFKCMVKNTSAIWQKYALYKDVLEIVQTWKQANGQAICSSGKPEERDMVDELLNSPEKISTALTKCWIPNLVELKNNYDASKPVNEQSANFNNLLNSCSNATFDNLIDKGFESMNQLLDTIKQVNVGKSTTLIRG